MSYLVYILFSEGLNRYFINRYALQMLAGVFLFGFEEHLAWQGAVTSCNQKIECIFVCVFGACGVCVV